MRYRIFRDHMGKLHLVRLSDGEVAERLKFVSTVIASGLVWTVVVVIAAGLI